MSKKEKINFHRSDMNFSIDEMVTRIDELVLYTILLRINLENQIEPKPEDKKLPKILSRMESITNELVDINNNMIKTRTFNRKRYELVANEIKDLYDLSDFNVTRQSNS